MSAECQGVQALFSGYLDGELSDEDRARVGRHIAGCPECATEFEAYKEMVEVADMVKFKDPPQEAWEHYWEGIYNRIERGAGWLVFVIGAVVLVAFGVYEFVTDPATEAIVKIIIAAPVIGILALLISVIREKAHLRKTDKYKEIQR